jgi:HK97 family phage major capsid protein
MSRELKDQRATLISQARAMLDVAETESRDLTAEEQTKYDETIGRIDALKVKIDRDDHLAALEQEVQAVEPRRNSALPGAPNFNRRTGVGDTEIKATAYYIRTGDRAALRGLEEGQHSDFMAASNATDLNVGTAADGGVLVPTEHFNDIVAKRNESALFGPLGVTPYNGGRGTTMNVPIETGSANVFVATGETPGTFDADAPAFNKAALTLVNFTKDIEITNDLLDMEDSGLMTFLTNYVGRALALTHNTALVTEILADGTSVALAAAAAATAGDVETMAYALQAEYADSAAFVMNRATLGKYRKITGDPFLYQATPPGGMSPSSLGGFPVYASSFLAAVGSGNKSMAFGNYSYVGMRETPLVFLYDPYSKASTGRKLLHYYTRIVYKVTNADAILYGKHPTA